jgi:hypothetical protein
MNTTTRTTSEQSNDVNTAHFALQYLEAGLSVIPVKLDKTPAVSSWSMFMDQRPTQLQISQWYTSSAAGIGIICGEVSGNVECLDIDEKYNLDPSNPLLDQLCDIVETQAPGLLSRLVHETSIHGGHHFVYRCNTIEGSKKLAERPATEAELIKDPHVKAYVLVETRGTRGYFVSYPSYGYNLISGSMTDIPMISVEERKIIFEAAMSMNQLHSEAKVVTGYPAKRKASIVRPGDDYNSRGDIPSVLQEHGWKLIYTKDNVQYWRRPGKKEGISATFGRAPRQFYVFSSSCAPFEPNTWYSPFAIVSLLKYNGQFEDAAKDLSEDGYGETEVAKAESYLEKSYRFRYNLVTGRVEYQEGNAVKYKVMQDFDLNSINRKLQKSHIRIGAEGLSGLLRSDFAEQYDPFALYYDGLSPWNGTEEFISELASTIILKNETERAQFVTYLQKWLVAAVACAVNPDIVNHTCLTLIGPQGRYKTTWLNRLVPKALQEYMHVGTIDPSDKDTLIHLSECYLINLDELETLNKNELGTLKSIMTWKSSRVRRPYAHFADQLVRRASFVGSINRSSFLTDDTGSRRFLVVEVESIDMTKPIDMDLVHAQAYALYRSGFRYWFDQDEIATLNEKNKEYSVDTTEYELVEHYCKVADLNKPSTIWYTATEVAQSLKDIAGYTVRSSSARDFGHALRKLGCSSKKIGGVTKYAVTIDSSTGYFNPRWGDQPLGGVEGGVKGGVKKSE